MEKSLKDKLSMKQLNELITQIAKTQPRELDGEKESEDSELEEASGQDA